MIIEQYRLALRKARNKGTQYIQLQHANEIVARINLEADEDGVNPRAIVVAKLDEIRQVVFESDLQSRVNLHLASQRNRNH